EAATPGGEHVAQPDWQTVDAVAELMGSFGEAAFSGYARLLHLVDLAALPFAGRRLSRLRVDRRERILGRMARAQSTYWLVRATTAPIKLVQVRREGVPESIGVARGIELPLAAERRRFEERIQDARELEDDEELEVDAIVVGTGAGGAPMAHSLARAGHAVLMIEEGDYFTRKDFVGKTLERQLRLFRSAANAAFGNTVIPIPIGKTVGGTTTVNSGTCFRVPADVMRRWRFEQGLDEIDPVTMEPYFAKVEAMLQVEVAKEEYVGGCGRVIAKGAERLGWSHGPLPRNAPDCDGQGVCCWGCPTDAKRSTNVSYIPAALEAGAMLFCNAKVERIEHARGVATGVLARATRADGSRVRIRVRAKVVVLACGALHTPALLMANDLCGASDQLGRNLTIHPASYAWARFDEEIRGWDAIPQGYGVDHFMDEGIHFEGAFVPLDAAAALLARVGHSWTDVTDNFNEMAAFGFMISDTSRGRVLLGRDGAPKMRYVLGETDRLKIIRGHALLARLYFEGGARTVYPAMQIFGELRDLGDVERLEREGPRLLRARHFDLSAYHPLGTARMGVDPRRSVVDARNETHELRNLYICDGSTVSGSLGVNPQITIMALAERAAVFVAQRIEEEQRAEHRRSAPPAAGPPLAARPLPAIEFSETMSGTCELLEGGVCQPMSFTVRVMREARGGLPGAVVSPEGDRWQLEGVMRAGSLAAAAPCEGSLLMHPRSRRLVYDLRFRGDDGERYRLYGEKSLGLLRPFLGMTQLHTEILREPEGVPVARGELHFDLRDLVPWLATFRMNRDVGHERPRMGMGAQPRVDAEGTLRAAAE
ncbi:MAG: GMC family oxidoreductase, partial [Myxococcales bacterium]|nr:GMC family oxidoreductase [Myxococcales bacterium]